MNFCNLLIFFILSTYWHDVDASFEKINVGANLTDFMSHRKKRSLIYEGGGTIKLVIGPTMPIQFGDPIAWRSMINTYNLHGGHYNLPTVPLYPWDKWEDTFARAMRKIPSYVKSKPDQLQTDGSRLFVYIVLEKLLNRQNAHKGRACLLRAICQNAQVHQHVGILAEVLNVILTPGKEELDAAYKTAQVSGSEGADCLKLYADCPAGVSLLDSYLDYL